MYFIIIITVPIFKQERFIYHLDISKFIHFKKKHQEFLRSLPFFFFSFSHIYSNPIDSPFWIERDWILMINDRFGDRATFSVHTRMARYRFDTGRRKKNMCTIVGRLISGMHGKIVCFANFSSRFFASAAFCLYPVYRIVSNLVRLIVKTSQTSTYIRLRS